MRCPTLTELARFSPCPLCLWLFSKVHPPVSDVVIKAENLGKKYTIGHQTERGRYVALRDVLVQNARTFWRTTADLLRGRPIIQGNHLEEVWALKDASFEIRRGEVVWV